MNRFDLLFFYGEKNGVDLRGSDQYRTANDGTVLEWHIEGLECPTNEMLDALIPEYLVSQARKNKLAELDQKFNYMLENGHTTSSFGVEIDANVTSVRNVAGLLVVMGADDKEWFCDYNNQLHELTRQQVETIQVEIITYIQGLYDQKWVYRNQINTLTTAEEINSIVIEFK